MQNLDVNITQATKKLWSDPEITILSVKSDTLGSLATSADTAVTGS